MSKDLELKHYWCDGVYLPSSDFQLRKKYINDKRKVKVIAWLGKTGQDAYKTIIHFGPKSLSCYSRDKDLTNCIPDVKSESEWIIIDVEQKLIEINLL